jgi:hypothetical protein
MSVFKRLSNVARGKMKEIGRSLSDEPAPIDPDDLPERDPRRDAPPPPVRRRRLDAGSESAPDPGSAADSEQGPDSPGAKRRMLSRMRDEGLLTDEEYEAKLASLDAPPPPPTPRKRRL